MTPAFSLPLFRAGASGAADSGGEAGGPGGSKPPTELETEPSELSTALSLGEKLEGAGAGKALAGSEAGKMPRTPKGRADKKDGSLDGATSAFAPSDEGNGARVTRRSTKDV